MSFSQGKGDRSLYFYDEEHDLACEITNIVYDYQLYKVGNNWFADGPLSFDVKITGEYQYIIREYRITIDHRTSSIAYLTEEPGNYFECTIDYNNIAHLSVSYIKCRTPKPNEVWVTFGPVIGENYLSDEDRAFIGISGTGDVVVDSVPEAVSVYNLQGVLLREAPTAEEAKDGLTPGLYIVTERSAGSLKTRKIAIGR